MAKKDCWYFVDGVRKDGFHKKLTGRASIGLTGDVSGLRGNVSGLRGNVSGLTGDISGLRGDISDIKIMASITQVCPQEGSFIAWKKCADGVIAKLEIPADAERLTYIGSRKCRCSKALVVSLTAQDGSTFPAIEGLRDKSFVYKVGECAVPDSFDPDIRIECSHGIHFFITREEAERWEM